MNILTLNNNICAKGAGFGMSPFPSTFQMLLRKSKRQRTRNGPAGLYLGSVHTDDPIAVPRDIVEVGDGDRLLACRHPVLLGAGVDLEDVCSGGEDGLFSARGETGARLYAGF